MRWKSHVRFGGRTGETHRSKDGRALRSDPYTGPLHNPLHNPARRPKRVGDVPSPRCPHVRCRARSRVGGDRSGTLSENAAEIPDHPVALVGGGARRGSRHGVHVGPGPAEDDSPDGGASTERVSVSTGGAQANGDSSSVGEVSPDGRWVVFKSLADNLIFLDWNGPQDIFLRDRTTGGTERVSIADNWAEANGRSLPHPAVSDDGRYVAFTSHANNLVAGDTNGATDVFVRDLHTGVTERVSLTAAGGQTNRRAA